MTLPPADRQLVQILDASMAEAVRKSGTWLLCRPGCCECCLGPFEITTLDALRLREGLQQVHPTRASAVMERARQYREHDDAPCPALDPETGCCDLYDWRPVTCRLFGPPSRTEEGGLAVCSLCYEGATEQQIAGCEVEMDPDGLESALLASLGVQEMTTVAAALRDPMPR